MALAIRTRLTLWYVATLAVILTALAAFLLVRLRADLVAGVDQALSSRASQIVLGVGGGGQQQFQDVGDTALRGLPLGATGAQILGPSGAVEDSTGSRVAARPMASSRSLALARAGSPVRASVTLGPGGDAFRVLAIALPGGKGRVLVVATSLDDVSRSVHRLAILLGLALPAALVFAALGGRLLAGRALRPVARMTAEASGIGADRLSERIEVPPVTDELQRLAMTLNAMLDRIEAAVEHQRRFVADASHELRTPLAVMRAELDVALRVTPPGEAADALSSTRDEVDRMARTAENLLTLARLDEGIRLRRDPVRLDELARRAARTLEPVARARGVSIEIEVAEPSSPVTGDPDRLGQVITNLVDNAIKYARDAGHVRVTVRGLPGEAVLSVADDGPGIPSEALTRVFERFFRVETSRSRAREGAGLGLAICREVVRAHGGRIRAESRPGHGAAFFVALPLSPSPPP